MGWSDENPIRLLLGLGFWVQGFRCLPWMAINFFLKDALKVAPSTLQLLQNSANLPMVGKPFYGVISDAVYICGEHRIPYIAIGVLLQAISWLSIALISPSTISIFTITLFLLLGNLGASIVEVANDALVAETAKQTSINSKSNSKKSPSGELQSFAWMLTSTGGVLGNLIGGIVLNRFSPKLMFLAFGLILAVQFFATISIREESLNLSKSSSSKSTGIKNQLSQLLTALEKQPEIFYSIAWFSASYAVIPVLTGTMFYYQTQFLNLDSSVLGLSKVFGQGALLLWSAMYNGWLKTVQPRKLISALQATIAVLMVSDVLFVKGIYREMGVSDSVYVVVFSGLLEVLFQFKVLPFSVLMAKLCPPGCEGSLMAFLMSAVALASIVSGYLGVALASFLGVSAHDFSGLPPGILIQAACTLLPLYWASWIPTDVRPPGRKND
ncbi:major facilitator superfamily protein [Tasmannia lanceolata]|uniref:major facilitator superfamily protein n=1 Tax=Tasmannia lanceolata TaxID=3420 RepID=UPI00406495BF